MVQLSKIFSLIFVIFLGISCLHIPFMGDQALFLQGALNMEDGGVLYKDFWDLKQPAIFFFYLIGGKLFGFSEVGVHIFELLYLVGLSVVLMFTTAKYFKTPIFVALVPIYTIGAYYCVAETWHLTQVEGLIGFPLYLSLWAISEGVNNNKVNYWLLLFAGIMGGVVGLFKLFYVPLICLLWLPALFSLLGQINRIKYLGVGKALGVISFGLLAPLIFVFGIFAYLGVGEILYKTTFVYPFHIAKKVQGRFWALPHAGWFLSHFYPLIALYLTSIYWMIKNSIKNPLLISLVMWVPLGVLFIHIQLMGWQYQYMLIVIPTGILSALALDYLWTFLKNNKTMMQGAYSRVLILTLTVVMFVPFLYSSRIKLIYGLENYLSKKEVDWLEFQERFKHYKDIRADVAFLKDPTSKPGKIFVFGSPIFYWLSDRNQAISMNGYVIEGYGNEQWDILYEELIRTQPSYIFIAKNNRKIIDSQSPNTGEFIDKNYEFYKTSEEGTWYQILF